MKKEKMLLHFLQNILNCYDERKAASILKMTFKNVDCTGRCIYGQNLTHVAATSSSSLISDILGSSTVGET